MPTRETTAALAESSLVVCVCHGSDVKNETSPLMLIAMCFAFAVRPVVRVYVWVCGCLPFVGDRAWGAVDSAFTGPKLGKRPNGRVLLFVF